MISQVLIAYDREFLDLVVQEFVERGFVYHIHPVDAEGGLEGWSLLVEAEHFNAATQLVHLVSEGLAEANSNVNCARCGLKMTPVSDCDEFGNPPLVAEYLCRGCGERMLLSIE